MSTMTTTECNKCGLVNRRADEVCQGCGNELDHLLSASSPPVDDPFSRGGLGSSAERDDFEIERSIRPFDGVGDALNPTISIFAKNIWLITKIVFVVFAPLEIFKGLSANAIQSSWQTAVGTVLLGLACQALIAPSLIYALVTVMRTGVAPSRNDSYRWGLSRLPKLVACALMMWALVSFGFILLVVPGIILSLAFALVYPMATLELLGPVDILKRSYNLTKGYRWRILGAGILTGLLFGIINIPVGIVSAVLVSAGIRFWPVDALLALIVDITNEATTVLSLVIYLGILKTAPSDR